MFNNFFFFNFVSHNQHTTPARMNSQCNVCGRYIDSKPGNLRRHIELHGPAVVRYKCLECGKSCCNKYNFKIHCFRNHNMNTEEQAMSIVSIVIENVKGIIVIIHLLFRKIVSQLVSLNHVLIFL